MNSWISKLRRRFKLQRFIPKRNVVRHLSLALMVAPGLYLRCGRLVPALCCSSADCLDPWQLKSAFALAHMRTGLWRLAAQRSGQRV